MRFNKVSKKGAYVKQIVERNKDVLDKYGKMMKEIVPDNGNSFYWIFHSKKQMQDSVRMKQA